MNKQNLERLKKCAYGLELIKTLMESVMVLNPEDFIHIDDSEEKLKSFESYFNDCKNIGTAIINVNKTIEILKPIIS